MFLCDNMNRGARFRAESLERGKRDSKYRSLTVCDSLGRKTVIRKQNSYLVCRRPRFSEFSDRGDSLVKLTGRRSGKTFSYVKCHRVVGITT
jgi:hypothetical protein